MESLLTIANQIKNKDFFYIITHSYPDGDALGSSFALCRALQKMGKHAKVMHENNLPEKFEFLNQYIENQTFEPKCVISVDLADTALLEPSLKKFQKNVDICIDHHISNKNYANATFVDSTAAAACEIIYELIKLLGISIDKPIANCLYVGISTDTGCFKYSSTTAHTHLVAAELINSGAEIAEINENIFIIKPAKKIECEKIIYKNLELLCRGKLAITHITTSEMQKIGINDGELDGIASIPVSIKGVDLGATIREKTDGTIKVSVRTSKNADANIFCAHFGGGGHSRAGGFNLKCNIEDAKKLIIKKFTEVYKWTE